MNIPEVATKVIDEESSTQTLLDCTRSYRRLPCVKEKDLEKRVIESFFDRLLSDSEKGATVIVILAILLPLIFSFSMLTIDNSRQQETARHLQSIADSAALAGAKRLDGKRAGWLAVKRHVREVIESSRIPGASVTPDGNATFSSGVGDAYEFDSILFGGNDPHSGTEARFGNVKVTVERGTFWPKSGGGNEFRSLEEIPLDGSGTRRIHNGLDIYYLANAVKVEIELSGLSSTFGSLLGDADIGTITKSSIATIDTNQQTACVFPIAVKTCDLQFRQTSQPPLLDSEIKYSSQCNRDIVATEAQPDFAPQDVQDGRLRAASHLLRASQAADVVLDPDTGLQLPPSKNALALPLSAVIGLPSVNGSSSPTTSSQLLSQLSGGCIRVKVGQFFNPVEDSSEILGNTALQAAMEQIITDTTTPGFSYTTFGEEYCNSPDCDPGAGGKKHFPFKTQWEDGDTPGELATIGWPVGMQGGNPIYDIIHTNNKPLLERKNPLCHSPNISTDPSGPVVKGYVMLVAPEDANSQYCDYPTLVEGQQEPNAQDISVRSKPRVVGFAEAVFYDTNFLKLFDEFNEDGTINTSIPAGVDPISDDRNGDSIPAPEELEAQIEAWRENVWDYITEHAQARRMCRSEEGTTVYTACQRGIGNRCRSGKRCNEERIDPCPDPAFDVGCGCTESIAQDCPSPPSPPVAPDLSDWSPDDLWKDAFFHLNPCADGILAWKDDDELAYENAVNDYLRCTGINAEPALLVAKPGKRVLPARIPGCFDLDHHSCYDNPPRHREAGFGCGGLAGTLTCNDDQSPFIAVEQTEIEARLVLVEES